MEMQTLAINFLLNFLFYVKLKKKKKGSKTHKNEQVL